MVIIIKMLYYTCTSIEKRQRLWVTDGTQEAYTGVCLFFVRFNTSKLITMANIHQVRLHKYKHACLYIHPYSIYCDDGCLWIDRRYTLGASSQMGTGYWEQWSACWEVFFSRRSPAVRSGGK